MAFTLVMDPWGAQTLIVYINKDNIVKSQDPLTADDCFTIAADLTRKYFGQSPTPQPDHGVTSVFCIDAP